MGGFLSADERRLMTLLLLDKLTLHMYINLSAVDSLILSQITRETDGQIVKRTNKISGPTTPTTVLLALLRGAVAGANIYVKSQLRELCSHVSFCQHSLRLQLGQHRRMFATWVYMRFNNAVNCV